MALVLSGFSVVATLKGENKGQRQKYWELEKDPGAADDNAAFATARAQATAMITQYKVISSATVLRMQVSGIYNEDAAAVPAAGVNVYKEAFLGIGLDAAGSKIGNHAIAAPADGIFSGDDPATGQIDIGDPQLATYMAFFAAPNFFRLSDGEQALSTPKVQSGKLRSVSSGKSY